MNEKKQNLITIPEILRLVIPEDANEYESCWRKTKNCTSPKVANYNRIEKWKERNLKYLTNYLKENLSQFASDSEHITLFANYIFGIYLKTQYDTFNRNEPNASKSAEYTFSYFINKKHLLHPNEVNDKRPRNKKVISTKEMAYFFTLFSEVNDCYAEMYYKLSQKKEEQIRKLIADTDILPSDSFQKLITIFFQED